MSCGVVLFLKSDNGHLFKKIFIISGFLISCILIFVILLFIDWQLFFETIQHIQPSWLILSVILVFFSVFIRSLRWNLIAVYDIKKLKHFWDATNLGYLGNLIYPARAGEILRIVALRKFIPIAEGRALSSSVIDRLSDGIMIPIFLVILIEYFGQTVNIPYPVQILALFFVGISIFVIIFIIWGKGHEKAVVKRFSRLPSKWIEKISQWYNQAHEGASTLKNLRLLTSVFSLSLLSFISDSLTYYALFLAFGWGLSFPVALLVCVFIFAGSTLPSTPGYFGIYQVACILAFRPFGISDTASVAYSLVLQCIAYTIFLIVGGWIIYTRGLSIRSMKTN